MAKRKDGPHWVKAWISDLSALTDKFRDLETGAVNFTELGKEEYKFRMALSRKDFTLSERARKVWDEAVVTYQQRVSARNNPQDAPNGNAGVDRKSATSCDSLTADGDTREGSQENANGSAITRNETRPDSLDSSANIYATRQAKNGDAANREGAEDCHHHSNVAIARPTTVSNPFALECLTRQGQTTAKTRDSRGSGRYQPPSLGPEDGNLYDQETASGNYQVPEVSTDEKRTGGHSPLSQSPSSRPPVRDRRVSGDVMSMAYSGEFGNVRLTQEQYNELGIRFGNLAKLNRAIDSLSCQIENGEKAPKSHYAELVKWATYRDDMDEKEELKAATQPHFETVSEHNARIVRESDKWIDEYYSQKRKAANGK